MATLDNWLEKISGIHPVGWDLGLERVGEVGRRLDVLRPSDTVVLVAGTNGKGSTCRYLSEMATAAGLTTGLSSSPHLFRFNERIVVDGNPVEDDVIVSAFEKIDKARGEISLTYFEFGSLASLVIFAEQGVDVSILEIGLGGRLDAMNIVSPDMTIITSIALDHQAWLGDTREDIGREKAGIMRKGVPCVIADPSPPDTVLEVASGVGAPLERIGLDFQVDVSVSCSLPAESFAAARQACRLLGWGLTETQIRTIGEETQLPGRKTWIGGPCRILLDVAHNPAAAKHLREYLDDVEIVGDIHLLMGIYADKDIAGVLDQFRGKINNWHFSDLDEDRGARASAILDHLAEDHAGNSYTYAKMTSAIEALLEMVKPEDLILVAGSFPIVAGVLEYFDETQGRA